MGMNFDELLKGTNMDVKSKAEEIKSKVFEREVVISLYDFMAMTAKSTHEFMHRGKNETLNTLSEIIILPLVADFIDELSRLLFMDHVDLSDIRNALNIKVKFKVIDFITASECLFRVETTKTHEIIKQNPEAKDLFKIIISEFLAKYFGDEWEEVINDCKEGLKLI